MIMKVTVVYNLPEIGDASDLDTQKSAFGVAEGLEKNYEVSVLGIKFNEINKIKEIKSGFVFNLIEWAGNEYKYGLRVIKELEKAGLPYSGSNAWGFELTSNKEIMKKKMDENKIPTPVYQVLSTKDEVLRTDFKFPVILKPISEHCGIGIGQKSLANNLQELSEKANDMIEKYDQSVLAEEFIDGRELQVTILEKNGEPWVLPAAEVVFAKKAGWKPILSYEGKWDEKSEEYKLSRMELAKLDLNQESRITNIARECYLRLGGRDYPRVDMRLKNNNIYVLEINNNPGIDYDIESGIGVSARAVNLNWENLLKHIVENAMWRFKV